VAIPFDQRHCASRGSVLKVQANFSTWLESGDTLASGAVEQVGSTDLVLGTVSVSTGYVEGELLGGSTVAASMALEFTVTASSDLAQGRRTVRVTPTSASTFSEPFDLLLEII